MSNIYQLLSRSPNAIHGVRLLVRAGCDIHDRSLHVSGRTVLEMVAASSDPNYAGVLKELVALGADVNSSHPASGLTPLHNAARYAPVETIRLLCQLGANPNARDDWGRTPAFLVLKRSAPMNRKDQVRGALLALFDAGGDSLAKDNDGMTLLRATRVAELKNAIRSAQIGDRVVRAVDDVIAQTMPAGKPRNKGMEPL